MFSSQIKTIVGSLVLLLLPPAFSDPLTVPAETQGEDDNCTLFKIDNTDTGMLTQQEKIARLDDALYDSVDRYDGCMPKMIDGGAAGSGSGSGSSGGEQASAGTGGGNESNSENESKNENVGSRQPQQGPLSGGTVPKDIPPADNDSIIQQQIRAAAMQETDPLKRRKLWDMYRKYQKK